MKIKKAVIPAAGLGTRFLPATKSVPKPMLPVYDKPTIQYIVEEAVSAGIEKVAIIVSPDCDVIKNHFSINKTLEDNLIATNKKSLYEKAIKTRTLCDIEYIVQPVANGLAGALLMAEDFVAGEPFAMLLGDEIYCPKEGHDSCLKRLCDEYLITGATQVASTEVFGDDIEKYGNFDYVEVDGRLKVHNLVEKPPINEAFSNMGSLGRAVISPSIFKHLKKSLDGATSEVYLTDAYLALAETEGLYACPFDDVRYDIGDKVGFIKANVDFALKDKKHAIEVADYIKSLSKTL